MLLFIDFCELWWLAWLLPFLLGLFLGWLLWSRFKSMLAASQANVSSLTSANGKLEADLTSSRNMKADLEGDVALMKGRVREMESEVSGYKSKLSAKGGGSSEANNGDKSKAELDRIKAELERSKAELDKNNSELDKLRAQLKECQDKGEALHADLESAKAKNASKGGSLDAGVSALSASGATAAPVMASSLAAGGGDVKPSGSGAKSNPYAKLKSNNLQIVEGIGPKMESVLHENGVNSWSELSGKSEEDLRNILNKYGDKYRIIDPSSWSAQASKAAAADWPGLITLQKSLDGGKGNTGNNSNDSKLEKLMMKMGLLKRYKQDDLKAVEGVGPKIAELLNNGGINTWRELANTDVAKIQGILDAAGSRYKLADPGTWPKQAELAADGKWDELTEYQDFLQGGK